MIAECEPSSTRERLAEIHARIAWGDADVEAAVAVARDLIEQGSASPAVLALATLELADGTSTIRARLDDAVRELGVALDESSVIDALLRSLARAVASDERSIEDAMDRITLVWSGGRHRALDELHAMIEDHGVALQGILAANPAAVLEELRVALLRCIGPEG